MSKKSNLLEFVEKNKSEIIEYLNNYAEECDDEMGSYYEDGKGLFEAFEHAPDFLLGVFTSMLFSIDIPSVEFDRDMLDDDDEELFADSLDEIENILF